MPSKRIPSSSSILQEYVKEIVVLKENGDYEIGDISFSTGQRHRHRVETYGLNFRIASRTVSWITDTRFFPELPDLYRGEVLVIHVVGSSRLETSHRPSLDRGCENDFEEGQAEVGRPDTLRDDDDQGETLDSCSRVGKRVETENYCCERWDETKSGGNRTMKQFAMKEFNPNPSNFIGARTGKCPLSGLSGHGHSCDRLSRSPQLLASMDEISAMLRDLFQTRNRLTIALPGTGSAGMEASFINFVEPGDHGRHLCQRIFRREDGGDGDPFRGKGHPGRSGVGKAL